MSLKGLHNAFFLGIKSIAFLHSKLYKTSLILPSGLSVQIVPELSIDKVSTLWKLLPHCMLQNRVILSVC
jgi:hypothetical protein